MQKKISVVIPTYDRPALLRGCLEALSQQTFASEAFEVIIVSDGPDQATAAVVAEWQSIAAFELRLLPLSYRKGPAAARNLGWQQASGTLIAFTHDDCLPVPRWLTSLWNAYQNEPEIAYSGKVLVPVSEIPTDYERNTAGMETVLSLPPIVPVHALRWQKPGDLTNGLLRPGAKTVTWNSNCWKNAFPLKICPRRWFCNPCGRLRGVRA